MSATLAEEGELSCGPLRLEVLGVYQDPIIALAGAVIVLLAEDRAAKSE